MGRFRLGLTGSDTVDFGITEGIAKILEIAAAEGHHALLVGPPDATFIEMLRGITPDEAENGAAMAAAWQGLQAAAGRAAPLPDGHEDVGGSRREKARRDHRGRRCANIEAQL